MLRPFCRVKIHRAVITEANVDYIGSMTIPEDLMARLDIREGEQVEVANVSNGERWVTYAITGKKAGVYTLNGAAAHLGKPGDRIIIMVFAQYTPEELKTYRMKVAFMNDRNEVERMQE
jgi:aspartate 1-decarboxylase